MEQQADGGYFAKCSDGFWWPAPACRGNTSQRLVQKRIQKASKSSAAQVFARDHGHRQLAPASDHGLGLCLWLPRGRGGVQDLGHPWSRATSSLLLAGKGHKLSEGWLEVGAGLDLHRLATEGGDLS